jgi:hypothetical protein
MYTTKEILNDLDSNVLYEYFLDLEHGYFFTAGSRITLFADKERWAIVFEKSGYGNRSGCAEIELNYIGNCIVNNDSNEINNQFSTNLNNVILIDNDEFEKISDGFELVSKKAKSIKVRDLEVEIETDIKKYIEKNIELRTFDNKNNQVDFPSLVRYLSESNKELFRATKNELYSILPNDLPLLMKIDEWYHTTIKEYGGPNPSDNETFNLIAEILVSKDISKWKLNLKPNNNWRNWPEAGGL